MPRVYTRILSDEAYAARMPSSQPAVVIAGGMKRIVRMKMGSEGRLTDLSVKQLETEGQVPFTVEVLKSKVPFPVFDLDIPVATAPNDSLTLYRVVPPMVGPAGFPVEFDEESLGYAYKNMDGGWTENQQFLYLLLTPTAGGPTTWKISMTVERDIGN
jgi:hypothetical protein